MKNLGDLNNWTKNDLARVIIQANHNLDRPAASNDPKVIQLAKLKKHLLITGTQAAIETINKRQFAGIL